MKKTSSFLKTAGFLFALLFAVLMLPVVADAASGKITVKVSSAWVRQSASTSSAQVGGVLKGETYDVIDTETVGDYTWYKITLSDGKTTGYVRGDLVTYSGSSTTSTSTSTSTVLEQVVPTEVNPVSGTVKGDVRVRAGASTKHDIVVTAKAKQVVTVKAYATGSDGKVWYQVEYTSGSKKIEGYIRSDYVTLSGELVDYVEPVVEPEPIDEPEPVVEPEPEKEPEKVFKDFEAVFDEDEGIWYLNNYPEGNRAKIDDLLGADAKAAKLEKEYKSEITKKNVVIVLLILVIVALLVAAAIAFVRFRQWYFGGDDETEEPVKSQTFATSKPASTSGVQMQTINQTQQKPQTTAQTSKPASSIVTNKLPDGSVRLPDGRIQMPDGTIKRPVAGVRLPDGSIKLSDGRIRKPDGTFVSADAANSVPQDTVSIAMKAGASSTSVREVPVNGARTSDDDDMEFGFLNFENSSKGE